MVPSSIDGSALSGDEVSEMETFDPALRDAQLAESVRRLPGPIYAWVLNWIHNFLKPANYVEIGVHEGASLHQALPDTPCIIGVDPNPVIIPEIAQQAPTANAQIHELTSDEFFARYDLTELLGGPLELAFIDGLHLFEQVLRDFVNLERHSCDRTIIAMHDCIPFDEVTASREQTTDFYSGDTWKAVLALRRLRPELTMVIVPTAPTGLCLVTGLDCSNSRLEQSLPEIVASYRELDFDYYQTHRDEMPEEIPNQVKSVGSWLRQTPALQH
jgi:Methyltransferase domain